MAGDTLSVSLVEALRAGALKIGPRAAIAINASRRANMASFVVQSARCRSLDACWGARSASRWLAAERTGLAMSRPRLTGKASILAAEFGKVIGHDDLFLNFLRCRIDDSQRAAFQ